MKKTKLSLCVIAGNAEKYIGRFLDHFEPLADEIVVVSAVGNQIWDETPKIVKARGHFWDDYTNANGNDWPHVDDFAAARNVAFSMASHDLIMWADMDDVISLESIAAIRDALERLPEDCDGLEIPYVVPEDGLTVFRERIIRKGTAEWVSPIHEHLRFYKEPKLARITNAHILHKPEGHRKANNERNLRILQSIPRDEMTGSHRFHLFQSLRACGRIEEASAELVDVLKNPPKDFGTAERYELFIAAGQMAEDPAQRAQLMLQALATDPTRREAYGEMVLACVGMGRDDHALAYSTAMRALPKPPEENWNLRGKYYGWLGESLHGMALRASGRFEEADVIEGNHFIRNGAKISLIHATRGRVKQAIEARRLWLSRAANPDAIEHIFGIDASDPHAVFLTVHNHAMVPGNGGPVAAWNAAAAKSQGQVLVQMSDDWNPPLHWDKMILDAIGDTSKESVLAVSDGHRTDDLLCIAIMTRARFRKQGNMFHPEFFSMFSDNWFSEQAFTDGVVIDARDRITFEHMHPAFGKAEMDATYARTNDGYHYKTGERIAERLRKGTTTSADIHGWFDFRDVYDHLAQWLPSGGTFAEIGCWKGKSIVYMAQRLQDLEKDCINYGIDTFGGDEETGKVDVYQEYKSNLMKSGVSLEVQTVKMPSVEAASKFKGQFDAVFIDAAHDEANATADIAAWLPKVKSGGILAGHDADAPGVIVALKNNNLKTERMGRCWLYKKP